MCGGVVLSKSDSQPMKSLDKIFKPHLPSQFFSVGLPLSCASLYNLNSSNHKSTYITGTKDITIQISCEVN